MAQESLLQVISIFDSPEKWNSFLELYNYKEAIKAQWYNKLVKIAREEFHKEGAVNGWVFQSIGNQDHRWYLEAFGPKSLCIRTCYWDELGLWVDPKEYDASRIHHMLNDSSYSIVLSCFNSMEVRAPEDDWKIQERGDYYFDSIYDGNFDKEGLSWYAGNKPYELLGQLTHKLNKIRADENITKLLTDLIKASKR